MGSRMTLAEKTYLKDRIGGEFEPILATLKDRLLPIKQRVREQLFKSLGLATVDTKIRKLVKQVEKLNGQFEEVTGSECVKVNFQEISLERHNGWNNGGTPSFSYADTPFARAVKDKVKASKESRNLNEAEAKVKVLQDNVMLAGFPEQLTKLMSEELPAAAEKFRRLAGLTSSNRLGPAKVEPKKQLAS